MRAEMTGRLRVQPRYRDCLLFPGGLYEPRVEMNDLPPSGEWVESQVECMNLHSYREKTHTGSRDAGSPQKVEW